MHHTGDVESGFDRADELVALLPWLRRRARTLMRGHDDAEDLVQDTVIRVMSCWTQFAAGTNFRAWVGRILANLCIERFRRQAREARMDQNDLEELPAPSGEPPEAWRHFELDDMRAALAHVNPRFRDVLLAQLQRPGSYRQLAVELGIPPATVATRLYRGRQELRAFLLRAENDTHPGADQRQVA
jgi:RNA polymerase sigma-70 factor (ECF subfamily)